jgi:hypothetical protein
MLDFGATDASELVSKVHGHRLRLVISTCFDARIDTDIKGHRQIETRTHPCTDSKTVPFRILDEKGGSGTYQADRKFCNLLNGSGIFCRFFNRTV